MEVLGEDLVHAAGVGNLEVVQRLVNEGAGATGRFGDLAYMEAVSEGHVDVVKYLVECGVGTYGSDHRRSSALTQAATHGRLSVVKYLVQRGANVNAALNEGHTTLMWAAQYGRVEVVKYLVECGADVNFKDSLGRTSLIRAAANKQWDVVKCLVECGADINATANRGITTLILAVASGRLDIVMYLVKCGADLNARVNDGETALLRVAGAGHLDAVKCLVECGADLNATTNQGWTALMFAAQNGHFDIVKYLVECGADVNAIDNYKQTAFIFAARCGRLNVVKHLCECAAYVNAPEHNWRTILMMAAENGRFGVVEYLSNRGADVKSVNNDRLMAAAVAARHGHLDIHRMLVLHASQSLTTTSNINSTQMNVISSRHNDVFISPFELNVIRAANTDDNTTADFIGTWLNAKVALKLFVSDAANTTFVNEVILWHRLRHPNIIKLYGACDVGHNLFVCELARNGTVVNYLKLCPQEYRRPWRYLHHAALGLAYLHERSIIHGDLRGDNILVGDDDQAKLANFGLSGSSNRGSDHPKTLASASHGFVGSWRWQSPEMLEGGKPSEASDVYALGLCVIEMLTGKIPWHSAQVENVRRFKRLWKPGSFDFLYQPGAIPAGFGSLIKQLCCQDPTRRLSASACAHLFEDLAKQEAKATKYQPMSLQERKTSDKETWHLEISKQWTIIQHLSKTGSKSAPESYLFQLVIDDLARIYDTIQKAEQPPHLLHSMYFLLRDTVSLLQSASQTTLVIQLSSTRATHNSMYALRRSITDIKRKLRLENQQSQGKPAFDVEGDNINRAPQTQIFISEISKTWLIMDELETSEERVAFLSYLYSEINQHGANYSKNQREIMQQAYDEIKSKLDANEDSVANLPVWFIPWYELNQTQGELIGCGGYGSVRLAKWLDSDVVVKRLESSLASYSKGCTARTLSTLSTPSPSIQSIDLSQEQKSTHEKEREMFEHEVNIWFNLSHPHVVRLFGACHVGRQPFFVCEYASNGPLDKYLLEHPEEIWTKLYEAALGLLYLHERGIVHCDLKCNNIVVGRDNKAKVTDFGLSLAANTEDNNTSKSGNVTGAWNWLAPELMLGDTDTPTRASDVFSFGMCIVEALRVIESAAQTQAEEEGKPQPHFPWEHIEDKVTVKVLMRRGQQLPARPAGCTNAQWELVEKMCKFNPSERIQMCTVVDEIAVLAGMPQQEQEEGQSLRESATMPSQIDVLGVVPTIRNRIAQEASVMQSLGPRSMIYQIHELLWLRLEDCLARAQESECALSWLGLFAGNAQSKALAISTHSDSLVDFTALALQAYDLHRRLDKLMAAAFARVDSGGSPGMNVHDWQPKCYELLGVESSIAAELCASASPSDQAIED